MFALLPQLAFLGILNPDVIVLCSLACTAQLLSMGGVGFWQTFMAGQCSSAAKPPHVFVYAIV